MEVQPVLSFFLPQVNWVNSYLSSSFQGPHSDTRRCHLGRERQKPSWERRKKNKRWKGVFEKSIPFWKKGQYIIHINKQDLPNLPVESFLHPSLLPKFSPVGKWRFNWPWVFPMLFKQYPRHIHNIHPILPVFSGFFERKEIAHQTGISRIDSRNMPGKHQKTWRFLAPGGRHP